MYALGETMHNYFMTEKQIVMINLVPFNYLAFTHKKRSGLDLKMECYAKKHETNIHLN